MSTPDPRYYEAPAPPVGVGTLYPEKPEVLEGDSVMQKQYITDEGYSFTSHALEPNRIEQFTVHVTARTLEQMSLDPKIHKARRIRINGVLTDELVLATGATEEEAQSPAEYNKYLKVMHFCERMIQGLETPIWSVLAQMLSGGYEQGHKIAETDWAYKLDKPTKKLQTGKRKTRPGEANQASSAAARWGNLKRFFSLKSAPQSQGGGGDQGSTPASGDENEDVPNLGNGRGTNILKTPQTRLMPRSIKVKPRGSVLFVVDAFFNLLGLIPGYGGLTQTWMPGQVITRDKFLVFTNDPTDDDPRGNSAWRAVFWAWSFKNFIPKQYLTYLLNEAVPVPVLSLPENMQPWLIERDRDGNIIYEKDAMGNVTTRPKLIETVVAAERTLKNIRGGKGVAIPPKSTLTAYGGNRGGAQDTVFPNAIRAADEQIEEGILLQPLAQSASGVQAKSASMTHENRLNDLFFWDKRVLCTMLLTDFFSVGVRMNLGEEWLAYLPKASLGDSEKRDWARDLEVISKAYFYGFIDDTQRAELCAWLGLPRPGQSRAEIALANQPAPGQGAQPGKEGAPAPPNNQRPDKQPGNEKRNDGNSTPKEEAELLLEGLYVQVRDREIAQQGFSTLGNYTRRRQSFVAYRP